MPPPMQAPWIAAMTGLRQRSIALSVSCSSSIFRRSFSRVAACRNPRPPGFCNPASMPEVDAGGEILAPAADDRHAGLGRFLVDLEGGADIEPHWALMALALSGRLNSTVTTPSAKATLKVSKFMIMAFIRARHAEARFFRCQARCPELTAECTSQRAAVSAAGLGRSIWFHAALNTAEPARFCPPSQTTTQPVMYAASGEARKAAVWPMSSTLPSGAAGRCIENGLLLRRHRSSRFRPSVPSIGPGTMLLARMPCGPHSSARFFISMSMPALAAPTCTWKHAACRPCRPRCRSCSRASAGAARTRRATR